MNEKFLGFHVSRLSRDRYQFEDTFFAYRGKAQIINFLAARGFATRMNQKRDIGSFPDQTVRPGQINAVALIHGITHYVFHLYCERHPELLKTGIERLKEALGPAFERTLDKFLDEFPPQPLYHRQMTPAEFLAAQHEARHNREAALEELVMLWMSNANPAFSPFFELFGDDALRQQTAYARLTAELRAYFDEVAQNDPGDARFPGGVNIIDILLEPVRAAPHSLEGQLRFLVEKWSGLIGAFIYRLLTSMDVISEEGRGIPGPIGEGKAETFVPYFERRDLEFERFTPDRDWMPNLVLIAKNAYVWLDQLSKKYQRSITHLDEVPDEELDQLAAWGFTGLWLIGLWERSTASQRIKVMCGNPDAVASAYSLKDYRIADRLGGDAACNRLKERAWQRGIRLASDMVPNHMGIDSTWVMQHPDWFLSLPYSPYPNYTFNGPNLSWDERVGIYLEDHYYNRSDAAVVFKRVDHWTGDTRYIYHGNDGTSMPWNDTAQLNYLHPEVREAMIQVILGIARQFPVIRFDAAMTLVKKHVSRLWFPEPGSGGAIPSRSEHGMTRADFDQAMPEEFWREVIDRAAVEAPDTLLLAEAFWLLEGYFVRTLGMHRVYNSAFMNMLRDEDNGKYRQVMKNTLEFDPEVLRRYVNFQNNPDEKTAVEQFGKGDKYFGVCTLMMTMPGLPMIGHGQIEGFAEKYGMEYYRAYWDEQRDDNLVRRHEHDISPLMKKRYLFAGVENFLLYDFFTPDGYVDEDVFAYSNRVGDERGVVLYNNRFHQTRGWIKLSAAYSVKTGVGDERKLIQRTVSDGLGLPTDPSSYCIFRELRSGLEYLRSCREIAERGIYADLGAYQCIVMMDFRIVQDSAARQYGALAGYLGGRGVPSVDDALRELLAEPVRAPFRALVSAPLLRRLLDARKTPDAALLDEVQEKLAALITAVAQFAGTENDSKGKRKKDADRAAHLREKVAALLRLPAADTPEAAQIALTSAQDDDALWGGLVCWLFVQALSDDVAQARSWMDEWLLGRLVVQALQELGVDTQHAQQTLAGVKLALAQRALFTPDAGQQAFVLWEALMLDTDTQQMLNIHPFNGIVWFNQQGFDALLQWLLLVGQLEGAAKALKARYALVEALRQAGAASGYQVEKLRAALRAPVAAEKPKKAAKPKKATS